MKRVNAPEERVGPGVAGAPEARGASRGRAVLRALVALGGLVLREGVWPTQETLVLRGRGHVAPRLAYQAGDGGISRGVCALRARLARCGRGDPRGELTRQAGLAGRAPLRRRVARRAVQASHEPGSRGVLPRLAGRAGRGARARYGARGAGRARRRGGASRVRAGRARGAAIALRGVHVAPRAGRALRAEERGDQAVILVPRGAQAAHEVRAARGVRVGRAGQAGRGVRVGIGVRGAPRAHRRVAGGKRPLRAGQAGRVVRGAHDGRVGAGLARGARYLGGASRIKALRTALARRRALGLYHRACRAGQTTGGARGVLVQSRGAGKAY